MRPALHPPPAKHGAAAGGGAAALEACLEALASGNEASRCYAARALARAGARDGRAAEALVAALRDPDADVRAEAAAAVGRLRLLAGARALAELMEGDPAGVVRLAAASALGHLGTDVAREALLRCFRAEGYPGADDPAVEGAHAFEVQSRALEALGEIGDARDFAPLAAALASGECDDSEEALLRVLAQLDRGRSGELLLGRVRSAAPLARRRAARALGRLRGSDGRLPARVTQALLETLLDADAGARVEAARGLAASGEPGAHVPLTLLLGDAQPDVRAEAARLLAGLRSERLLERLHALLADPALCRTAVRLLGEIGDERSAAPLLALLDGAGEDLRFDLVAALGGAGRAGCEAALAAILSDAGAHQALRAQAARSLGKVLRRSGARDAFGAALVDATLDADEHVAQAALGALADAEPEAAADRLAELLDGKLRAEATRLAAVRLIGACASVGERALEALRRASGADSPALRREAIVALTRAGDARVPPLLLAALGDPAAEVRLAALEGLVALREVPAPGAQLAGLCRDADFGVRALAVRALASAAHAPDAGRLLRAALEDEHPAVCRAALRAIAEGRGGSGGAEALARLAFRFRGDLRREAAAALGRLEGVEDAVARMRRVLAHPEREADHWIALEVLGELQAAENAQ